MRKKYVIMFGAALTIMCIMFTSTALAQRGIPVTPTKARRLVEPGDPIVVKAGFESQGELSLRLILRIHIDGAVDLGPLQKVLDPEPPIFPPAIK